jgi:hypothetical protein
MLSPPPPPPPSSTSLLHHHHHIHHNRHHLFLHSPTLPLPPPPSPFFQQPNSCIPTTIPLPSLVPRPSIALQCLPGALCLLSLLCLNLPQPSGRRRVLKGSSPHRVRHPIVPSFSTPPPPLCSAEDYYMEQIHKANTKIR